MAGSGGKRKGAGRPKGAKSPRTIDALKVKQEVQDRIRKNANKLVNAQLSLATGIQMLFVIYTNSKGIRSKPELITDQETIIRYLDGDLDLNTDEEYYFMTTRVPESRAIEDMLNRALGKPTENIDLTSGGEKIARPIILAEIKPRVSGTKKKAE